MTPSAKLCATVLSGLIAMASANAGATVPPPPTARPHTYPTYPKPSPTDPMEASPSASPSPVATTPTAPTPRPTRSTPRPKPSPAAPTVTSASSPTATVPTTTDAPSPATTPPATTSGTTLTYTAVRTTGYGLRDNDCGGGGGDCTAFGDGHAGGVGTYTDPVSIAVGGRWLPAGTLMYIPYLHRYGIVEDTCGACTGPWIDIWVNGSTTSEQAAELCMRSITGRHTVVLDPPPGLPEDAGVISSADGCARQYGDVL